jgi:hypothetical protein
MPIEAQAAQDLMSACRPLNLPKFKYFSNETSGDIDMEKRKE